jgi:hypothetical protein
VSAVLEQPKITRRTLPLWLLPVQAASVFTLMAIGAGGQFLRTWFLGALTWLLALPLLVSLEAGLVAMMLFEPFRGIIRRGQYLFIEYSSEDPIHVITPIVTIFALVSLLRSHRLAILRASPLATSVSLLALVYLLEVFNPLQGGLVVGLSGAMFALIPLLWFYFGQYVQHTFIRTVLKLMILLGLLTSLYGIYQLIFGYPRFEQYWIDNTEFYTSIALGHVERALATFCSAEEWGRYIEFGAIAAFGFSMGQKRLAVRAGWLAAGIGLCVFMAFTGQRAAVFGLAVGLIALLMLSAQSVTRGLARTALLLLPFVLLTVLLKAPEQEDVWTNDENDKVSTVLSHTQRGMLKPAEEASFQERMTNWGYLLTDVIPYRPLGSGVGAGSLAELRFSSDAEELPPIDNTILLHGITCGFPGMLLFVWILSHASWIAFRGAKNEDQDPERLQTKQIIAALMCALIVNSIFGLTFTLYSVAPLVWLFMGWVSVESLKTARDNEREVLTI